jgi:predicted Fe-Mo cluster-binding NifX family protein
LAKYNKKTGEEINSQAMVGQAKNFTLDVYSSLLVFVGILGSYWGIPWIDGSIGALISVFILKAGASLGKDAVLTLMDAVWKPEHVSKVKSLAEEVPGVMGVHDIKIRKSGPFCFGEMHMEVAEGLSVEKAHALTEEVECKLKQECEELEALIIHVEPAKKVEFRVAIPIEKDKGLESGVNSHFRNAPYFILVDIDKGQIKTWTVRPNPGARLDKKRGITIADFLVKEKIDILLVNELGEGPFHVLRDSSVELYRLPTDSKVREVIKAFNDGKLEKLLLPKKES